MSKLVGSRRSLFACGLAVAFTMAYLPSVAAASDLRPASANSILSIGDIAPTSVGGTLGTLKVGVAVSGASVSADAAATPAPTFAVTSGGLPDGLNLNTTTGVITGTPTTAGAYTFTVTATNPAGSATATFTGTVAAAVVNTKPTAVSSTLNSLTVGTAVTGSVTADGTPAPTFTRTGTLPVGVTFDTGTGVFGGTPATPGDYTFTITATNSEGSASTVFTGAVAAQAGASTSVSTADLTRLAVDTPMLPNARFTSDPGSIFAVTPAMPAGLSLAANGAVSGQPTTAGPYSFTITATDDFGSASTTFTGTIEATTGLVARATTFVSASMGLFRADAPSSGTVFDDGIPPATFTVTDGALPVGMNLNPATGLISGTPDTAGQYSFTITATNLTGTATATFNGTVVPAAGTTTPTIVNGSLGSLMSGTRTVTTDGTTPTFAVSAGLPAGLSLDGATGAITGTPTAAGAFGFTVTGTNSNGSAAATFNGQITATAPTAVSGSLGPLKVGTAVASTSVSADGAPAATFEVTAGALPAGLALDTATGAITGTPTTAGPYNVTITATVLLGGTATISFAGTISVAPTSVSGSLGILKVGTGVSVTLTADGSPAPTFAVTAGALPAGLALDAATGVITGTPTTPGAYSFTIAAFNGGGSASTSFTGTVYVVPTAVSGSLGSLTVGTAVSVTLTADGSPAPTFAVTAGALPAGLALNATTGAITGTPTAPGAYSFTITASNGGGSASASFTGSVEPSGTSALTQMVPLRLLDTRMIHTPLAAGGVQEVQITGVSGVPADTVAVVLNVTATEPQGPGFLTVFPCSTPRPDASNVNFVAGQTVANAATVPIGTNGKVCIYSSATVHLIVDINGVYNPSGSARLVPLVPRRLLDTRQGGVPVDAESVKALHIAGANGVPADAVAVTLNVTEADTTGTGFVTVFPCGASRPDASNLNFTAGKTVANAVTATIGSGGDVCFYTNATINLIVDLNGAYTPTGNARFAPLDPRRLLDTRVAGVPVAAGSVHEVQVAGAYGVPADVVAVVLNVTATDAESAGFATVFPCAASAPDVSNVNFAAGQTVANAVTVPIGLDGKVCFYTSATFHFIVDIDGAYRNTI